MTHFYFIEICITFFIVHFRKGITSTRRSRVRTRLPWTNSTKIENRFNSIETRLSDKFNSLEIRLDARL